MAAGYTLDELRSLYNRNRYTRDVWDKLHDFAPGLTQAELEKIVGETRNEQYAGRKKKAVSMRASGAKPEEIAKTIGMSVGTVRKYICKWAKRYAVMDDHTPSPAGMAQGENASAEKEAPAVGGLIREAMKVISGGKLGDGERISVERSELGTTVLIETLA